MLESLSGETLLYPIIGDPVSAAQSPRRLTDGFSRHGHNGACVPMRVAQGDLDAAMDCFGRVSNVDGLLVTMPHKFTAWDFCATGSATACLFGVVSVIRRNMDGSWHGDMLDGDAFLKAQVGNGANPDGARVLLLGAGGAGSAIALALLHAGVGELTIYDTAEERTTRLLEKLTRHSDGRARSGKPDLGGFDMVCNATPMGMAADDPSPIDLGMLKPGMFVGDVIAGHGETKLLRAAREAGCKTASGNEMVEAVQGIMLDFFTRQSI